jgi:carboxypeptidase D
VHQERNLTYALFPNAGHFVPRSVPQAVRILLILLSNQSLHPILTLTTQSLVFLREFILGSNTTGLVEDTSGDGDEVVVVGGEDPVLADDVLPGTNVIFYGSGTTASSLVIPSETFASWSRFIATVTAEPVASSAA